MFLVGAKPARSHCQVVCFWDSILGTVRRVQSEALCYHTSSICGHKGYICVGHNNEEWFLWLYIYTHLCVVFVFYLASLRALRSWKMKWSAINLAGKRWHTTQQDAIYRGSLHRACFCVIVCSVARGSHDDSSLKVKLLTRSRHLSFPATHTSMSHMYCVYCLALPIHTYDAGVYSSLGKTSM